MSRLYIRAIRLGRWFPPGDKLAAAIARLIILREDFMLELHGIIAGCLSELDNHSTGWRKTYFFRNSVRTLWEIQGTLTTIRMSSEFKHMLSKRTSRERSELRQICAKLNAASKITKAIRDSLGGHVLQGAVEKALDNIPYDHFGILQVGKVIGRTHFKMAGELVAEIVTGGVPESEKLPKLQSDIRALAGLLPVVESLDQVLKIYIAERGLL